MAYITAEEQQIILIDHLNRDLEPYQGQNVRAEITKSMILAACMTVDYWFKIWQDTRGRDWHVLRAPFTRSRCWCGETPCMTVDDTGLVELNFNPVTGKLDVCFVRAQYNLQELAPDLIPHTGRLYCRTHGEARRGVKDLPKTRRQRAIESLVGFFMQLKGMGLYAD